MKSSQAVMKQRCRELGLFVSGDKQALLTRIVNEENRLTTDRQVKDNDTDQEMLCTFKGTETLPIMDNMPWQHSQAEINADYTGEFERCSELMQWFQNHSGKRPRRRSDDKSEVSLARWLTRALIRRTRAVNNRPCLRQLTTKETARLNNIIFIARDLNPAPEDTGSTALPDDFERCNELRRWCLSHSGERPRCRSHDKKQTSLADWLAKARIRRAHSISIRPSGRQLTKKETAQLNSILASTHLTKRRTTAKELNPVPEGTQQPEPSTRNLSHLNNIIATQRPKMPLTKDHFERCNELRQWCLSHSGERPRIRSDDKSEASLAIWLQRALIRRTRSWSSRPSTRQLTASETELLNSIVRATVTHGDATAREQ